MVGVAAATDAGLVFSALDPRLDDGQGARFRDVSEARRAAVVVFWHGNAAGCPSQHGEGTEDAR
ncbi:MAG: hypothetical protein K2X49_16450 [Acetobacteraceae bacterium]|nr:hypothetical protein [Acetobacteraceae bacterium]